MSDERLRELERHWRMTRTVEDEAAWLRARVQAGELEQSRLALAAYCGHEAASPTTNSHQSAFPDWLLGIQVFGPAALARAVLALVEAAVQEIPVPSPKEPLSDALEAVLVLFLSPTPEAEDAARTASRPLESQCVVTGWDRDQVSASLHGLVHNVLWDVVTGFRPHTVERTVRHWVAPCATHLGERRAAGIVRARVSEWALGYSDPIRERIEARQRRVAGG